MPYMRGFIFPSVFVIFCFLNYQSTAQSSANYSIENRTNGNLRTDLNGNIIDTTGKPNLIDNWASTFNSDSFSIGFDFVFMGKPYTQFIVGPYGQMGLGINGSPLSILATAENNDLTHTFAYPPRTANTAPILSAFWDKMSTPRVGPTIRSVLTGNAPTRCRIIEWNTLINTFATTTQLDATFQIRLYESTGIIEYVYGKMTIGTSANTVKASIGFTAGTTDNNFIALQNLTTFPFTTLAALEPATQNLVNSATAGEITGLHSPVEGQRRLFRFTPPVLSGATNLNIQLTDIAATIATLQWNDNFSNESHYNIFRSSDNINFSFVKSIGANSTSFTDSNLVLGNTYYWKVQAATEGSLITSNEVTGTTYCALNGRYTVGTGGNFPSLTKVADGIKTRGVAGNLVFELLNSYNSSNEASSIVFPKDAAVPCLGNNRITIRPAADVNNIIVNGNSNSTVLLLDSVNYLIIDGRPGGIGTTGQLTISNSQAAPALRLINASNNKFLHINFSSSNTSSSSLNGLVSFTGSIGNGCDNNKVEACNFFSNVSASNAKPVLLYSSAVTNRENNNDSIINCNFYDFSNHAIRLENFNDSWKIIGNSFFNTTGIIYNRDAAIIKINSPSISNSHIISQNHFGGTLPGGLGNPMNIDYKSSFTGVYVSGNADITNNYFTRMRFFNSTNSTSISNGSKINLVYTDSGIYNPQLTDISGNQFGSLNSTDSLHCTQSFEDNNIEFTGIQTIEHQTNISNNQFNYIRCYSQNGGITLRPIFVLGIATNIYNNTIGNPAVYNSIINNGNSPTYGINCIGAAVKINNNTISRFSVSGGTSDAALEGISISSINNGSVDSVCNNSIFQLSNGISQSSNYPTIKGIALYVRATGAAKNLVENNNIYALQNLNTTRSGTVIGILSGEYLEMRRNFIHSLNAASATSITGIDIPEKYATVENNMISLGLDSNGASITNGAISFVGVSGGHVMTHNSIYIGGSNVTDGFIGSNCYLFLGNALPTACFNNIFYNARSNASPLFNTKHQCANIDLSYGLNYNLYYFDGVGGILGTYGRFDRYNTFNDWKTGTGLDVNSIFANPSFVSPSSGSGFVNLHLNYGSPADGGGGDASTGANTLALDFDNENRSILSPIDIGADAGNYSVCPVADAGFYVSFFEGASIQIGGTAIAGVTYSWTSNPAGFTSALSNPVISPSVTTTYILTITSGSCSSTDTIIARVFNLSPRPVCPGGDTTLFATVSGTVYQWQVNTGSGYTNISNNATYSGTNTNALGLINLPSSFYGYKYRCVVDGTTDIATTLKIENNWTGSVNNFWNNPANWSCGNIPDGNTDVVIASGSVILNTNGTCRSIYVAPGATFTVSPGVTLTITH